MAAQYPSVLQGAERVDVEHEQFRNQSNWQISIVHTARRTHRTRKKYRLSWDHANATTAKVISDHFEKYGNGSQFYYAPPGTVLPTAHVYPRPQISMTQSSGNHYQIQLTIAEAMVKDNIT